jgi:hypothetical protein
MEFQGKLEFKKDSRKNFQQRKKKKGFDKTIVRALLSLIGSNFSFLFAFDEAYYGAETCYECTIVSEWACWG